MKETFIGNNLFKNYSKEAIEKVADDQDLVKIRFYCKKDSLSFQCVYTNYQGIVHSQDAQVGNHEEELIQHRLCEDNEETTDIYIKYLFSMKFFFRSKIVGVECRIKTDKGTKNVQIGHCDPNVKYALFRFSMSSWRWWTGKWWL